MADKKILLVDDEDLLIIIGERVLKRNGYNVITSTCSETALEIFRSKSNDIDIAIIDLIMPKMTGDQLARELMKIRPNIPIILCTGFSPKISEKQAKEIGIKAFAMKPLVRRDMANTVRKVLDAGQSEV